MRDGDNDVGLYEIPEHLSPPYNRSNAFNRYTGAKVDMATLKTPELLNDVIRYRDKKIYPFDTLPNFVPPYSCRSWNVINAGGHVDTVYMQQNPFYYNLEVSFLIESAAGKFEPFDFAIFPYPSCSNTFSGRIPVLDFSGTPNTYLYGRSAGPFRLLRLQSNAILMEYNIASIGFHAPIWQSKRVKLRVNINDRALHRSNVIETDIVQL